MNPFQMLSILVLGANAIEFEHLVEGDSMRVVHGRAEANQVLTLGPNNPFGATEFVFVDIESEPNEKLIRSELDRDANLCLKAGGTVVSLPIFLAPCDEDDILQRFIFSSDTYLISAANQELAVAYGGGYTHLWLSASRGSAGWQLV